jgi:hypothetical protein
MDNRNLTTKDDLMRFYIKNKIFWQTFDTYISKGMSKDNAIKQAQVDAEIDLYQSAICINK